MSKPLPDASVYRCNRYTSGLPPGARSIIAAADPPASANRKSLKALLLPKIVSGANES